MEACHSRDSLGVGIPWPYWPWPLSLISVFSDGRNRSRIISLFFLQEISSFTYYRFNRMCSVGPRSIVHKSPVGVSCVIICVPNVLRYYSIGYIVTRFTTYLYIPYLLKKHASYPSWFHSCILNVHALVDWRTSEGI